MTVLTWDNVGDRLYETGVDHGVLYQLDETGAYVDGVAWNGLTTVTESPSGAESNKQYADNIVYVNLLSAEEFGGTIEAYTYPDEFGQNDGTSAPAPGVAFGQQGRRPFGMVYRTLQGNDVDGQDHGYKLHLVYGALASPSEKAYATVNDSPEAIAFSWEFTTTPNVYAGGKPVSLITIDSTTSDEDDLATLEDILFGTVGDDPRLPSPDEVITIFTGAVTDVNMAIAANQPTFVAGTGVITIPVVTGVTWSIDGEDVSTGAQPAIAADSTAEVNARASSTAYNLVGDTEWSFYRP
jgi:hypothetical protein